MSVLERTKPEGVKKQDLLNFLNQKARENKETHRMFLFTNEIEYLANLVAFDMEVVDTLCDMMEGVENGEGQENEFNESSNLPEEVGCDKE